VTVELYCLPVKTAVLIGGEVQGVITAIIVRPAFADAVAVLYECEWWDGGDVKCGTFSSFQVQPIGDVRPAQIGFNPGSSD
jgi:uncharacterized protein YodC (DUF2158 family)